MSLHLEKLMGPQIRSEEALELARLAALEIAPRTRSQARNRLLRAGTDHWHWMRRGDFGKKRKGTFRVIKVRSSWRRPDDPRPKVDSALARDVLEYPKRAGARLIGAVAHANETLRTVADRVTLKEGTDLHLVPGDACLLARACARTCEEQVSRTCTLCAGDLGGDLYTVLAVARTAIEDTLFEAVRVAQKLGLTLDAVLLEAIIGDGAPPGTDAFKPIAPTKEAPIPSQRPFSPPTVDESRPPSRGTAERWSEFSNVAAPAPAPPSKMDVAMTLLGRSALLHRGTYVRDREVRYLKHLYEDDPEDRPRAPLPAKPLALERAGAAVQDLLYALLMLDSLLDAGPPRTPHEAIERARHLELGRGHQKYLAGRRADLKLGREPAAEEPPVVVVEEVRRPATPPPQTPVETIDSAASEPSAADTSATKKASKMFGGMMAGARGFMKKRPKRGAWARPSSRESDASRASSRESSAEGGSRPGSRSRRPGAPPGAARPRSRSSERDSSAEPPARRASRLRSAGNAMRSFGRRPSGSPSGSRPGSK